MKSIKGLLFLLLGTISLLQSAAPDVKELEEDFAALAIEESDDAILVGYPELRGILVNGGDLDCISCGVHASSFDHLYASSFNHLFEGKLGRGTIGQVYMFAAYKADDLAFARLLVRKGFLVDDVLVNELRDRVENEQNSVVRFLCACHDLCIAGSLKSVHKAQDALAQGAYINAKTLLSGTALNAAMAQSVAVIKTLAMTLPIVTLLISTPGVDVNGQGRNSSLTYFVKAIHSGSLELVELFLEKPELDFDCVTSNGQTALDFAKSLGASHRKKEMAPIIALLEDFKNNRVSREAFLQWSPLCLFYVPGVVLIVADYMSTSNPRQA